MDNIETLNKLVDEIIDGNNVDARETFENLISVKVSDALEQRKQEVAQDIYNDNEYQDSTEE